jgi:PleD family two-component response regulator
VITFTVESREGQDSVFRVYLPLSAEEPHRQPADATANDVMVQESGTVLLVDDDEIVLKITTEMLSGLGFTVFSAADSVEALKDAILRSLAEPGKERCPSTLHGQAGG